MTVNEQQSDLQPDEISSSFIKTVVESLAFNHILDREYKIGANKVLDEILDKKVWTNAEMIWVLKQMMSYYGGNDKLLKKAPVERIFLNMVGVIRALYLFLDHENSDIDENTRSYMSAKIGDATWGLTDNTRIYLEKMP